jgi:hypothetical protein
VRFGLGVSSKPNVARNRSIYPRRPTRSVCGHDQ